MFGSLAGHYARVKKTRKWGKKTLIEKDDMVVIFPLSNVPGKVICFLPDGHHVFGLDEADFEIIENEEMGCSP